MAYSPDQQRDDHGRFASNGGPSTARAEKIALGKALDQRNRSNTRPWDQPQHNVSTMQNITHGLLNQFGGKAPSESRVRQVMAAAAESGAHTVGVHAATAGKTLAQFSAEGTNPNIPPPKIGGAP